MDLQAEKLNLAFPWGWGKGRLGRGVCAILFLSEAGRAQPTRNIKE